VEQILVPALHRGDVVIFDNLGSHLSSAVFEAIEGAGASVLPLPPYSPDYTSIEEMFSKFKGFLRPGPARTFMTIWQTLRPCAPGPDLVYRPPCRERDSVAGDRRW
jgi:hypothetical protein